MTIMIIPVGGQLSHRLEVVQIHSEVKGAPVHQIQFFRYACPSPVLLPYLRVALNSPFFLTTKLCH